MTAPSWSLPRQQRRHLGLVAALVVCLLVIIGGSGLSGYLLYHAGQPSDPTWPPDWHTAAFQVGGDDSTRLDAGRLLTMLAGSDARYEVRGARVVVGVRGRDSASLSRLRRLMPIRTSLSLHPVLGTSTPSPRCTPGDRPACDQDGVRYRLGPALLAGTDVAGVHARSDARMDWSVTVRFTDAGQQAITDATERYTGKQLALVAAGAVVAAPQVTAKVDGPLQLSGGFGAEQARRLAAALRLGQHPVDITRS